MYAEVCAPSQRCCLSTFSQAGIARLFALQFVSMTNRTNALSSPYLLLPQGLLGLCLIMLVAMYAVTQKQQQLDMGTNHFVGFKRSISA